MYEDNPSQKYFKKIIRYSHLFQTVPFVRAILLNGSLSSGTAKDSSDIDLLTITKSGRLYTARFFLVGLGIISRQKRSKDERKSHAGKFCFNHFLTDQYLVIPVGRGKAIDQYCADSHSKSVLLWGEQKIFADFQTTNKAMFKQSQTVVNSNFKKQLDSYFPIRNHLFANISKNALELMLEGRFGDWLELKLKERQVRSIESDARTKKYPNLIVYNDLEARFHPPKENINS